VNNWVAIFRYPCALVLYKYLYAQQKTSDVSVTGLNNGTGFMLLGNKGRWFC